MKFFRTKRATPGAGMTTLEMTIALTIMLVVAGTITQSMQGMQRLQATGQASGALQAQASKAIERVVADLKGSGYAKPSGLTYPHFFTNGSVGPGYPMEHDHTPADKHSEPEEAAAGLDREVLFLRWRDADQNGIPDINLANSTLIWDEAAPISYTVVTLDSGENALQRRVTGEAPRIVARGVERFWCEGYGDIGAGLPASTVRIQLWLRAPVGDGSFVTEHAQATIRLRNGAQ